MKKKDQNTQLTNYTQRQSDAYPRMSESDLENLTEFRHGYGI